MPRVDAVTADGCPTLLPPPDTLRYTLYQTRSSYSSSTEAKQGSPYSITERRVPELIPLLGSQLPLVSARPAVTPATLKRAATSFAAW